MNHIDLVDKYYDLNKDKKLVRFHLNYENLDEALELSFNNTYRFKKEIIEQIDEQLNDIPKEYKCDLEISFKEKIDSKAVVNAFLMSFHLLIIITATTIIVSILPSLFFS